MTNYSIISDSGYQPNNRTIYKSNPSREIVTPAFIDNYILSLTPFEIKSYKNGPIIRSTGNKIASSADPSQSSQKIINDNTTIDDGITAYSYLDDFLSNVEVFPASSLNRDCTTFYQTIARPDINDVDFDNFNILNPYNYQLSSDFISSQNDSFLSILASSRSRTTTPRPPCCGPYSFRGWFGGCYCGEALKCGDCENLYDGNSGKYITDKGICVDNRAYAKLKKLINSTNSKFEKFEDLDYASPCKVKCADTCKENTKRKMPVREGNTTSALSVLHIRTDSNALGGQAARVYGPSTFTEDVVDQLTCDCECLGTEGSPINCTSLNQGLAQERRDNPDIVLAYTTDFKHTSPNRDTRQYSNGKYEISQRCKCKCGVYNKDGTLALIDDEFCKKLFDQKKQKSDPVFSVSGSNRVVTQYIPNSELCGCQEVYSEDGPFPPTFTVESNGCHQLKITITHNDTSKLRADDYEIQIFFYNIDGLLADLTPKIIYSSEIPSTNTYKRNSNATQVIEQSFFYDIARVKIRSLNERRSGDFIITPPIAGAYSELSAPVFVNQKPDNPIIVAIEPDNAKLTVNLRQNLRKDLRNKARRISGWKVKCSPVNPDGSAQEQTVSIPPNVIADTTTHVSGSAEFSNLINGIQYNICVVTINDCGESNEICSIGVPDGPVGKVLHTWTATKDCSTENGWVVNPIVDLSCENYANLHPVDSFLYGTWIFENELPLSPPSTDPCKKIYQAFDISSVCYPNNQQQVLNATLPEPAGPYGPAPGCCTTTTTTTTTTPQPGICWVEWTATINHITGLFEMDDNQPAIECKPDSYVPTAEGLWYIYDGSSCKRKYSMSYGICYGECNVNIGNPPTLPAAPNPIPSECFPTTTTTTPCPLATFNDFPVVGFYNGTECLYNVTCYQCSECPYGRTIEVPFERIHEKACEDFLNVTTGQRYVRNCVDCTTTTTVEPTTTTTEIPTTTAAPSTTEPPSGDVDLDGQQYVYDTLTHKWISSK